MNLDIRVRYLGRVDYESTWHQMQEWTQKRAPDTVDELWQLEHFSVYTLGVAGDLAHILHLGDIPFVRTNRGGQITYHGPGQIVLYPLLDLHRRGFYVRQYVNVLEQACIDTLAYFGVHHATRKADAPGVYVPREDRLDKIAALGVKIHKGRTYHGLALNVNMDLTPFLGINPCGYAGLKTIDMKTLGLDLQVSDVLPILTERLIALIQENTR